MAPARNRLAWLLCIALVAQPVCAELALSAGKPTCLKGESLQISGRTSLAAPYVALSARVGSAVVFEGSAPTGPDGAFSLAIPVGDLDPQGTWAVEATASAEGRTESARTEVEVRPTSLSARYVVGVLSPSPLERYRRTENVTVTVNVTTAGAPVLGATVRTWGPRGGALALAETGGGAYSITVPLAFDEPVGTWDIPIVAAREGPDGTWLGGDNAISVSIEPTQLSVAFVEPRGTSFHIEEEVPVRVSVSYETGAPVARPSVSVTINGAVAVNLSREADGTFAGRYAARPEDVGVLTFAAAASDGAGNGGSAQPVTVSVGGWTEWYLGRHLATMVAVAVAACVAFVVARSHLRSRSDRKGLEKLYLDLQDKQLRLQQDYYDKGAIDRKTFEKKSVELETEAAKVRGRLAKIGVDAETLAPAASKK